jgi:DNA-binding Lrp family transcriptional regulator
VDEPDLAILKAVQKDFPLDERPYDALGHALGMTGEEVHSRVRALLASGVIRRIAPMFDRRALGFGGCLVAAKVSPEAVDAVAKLLEGRPEVTHNYLRTGEFNVWFTVMLREGETPDAVVGEVRSAAGVSEVIALPSRRVFKLDASFPLGDNGRG